MHWNFALAASQSGAPGYAPDGRARPLRVMQEDARLIKSRHGVKITGISFMGASLARSRAPI